MKRMPCPARIENHEQLLISRNASIRIGALIPRKTPQRAAAECSALAAQAQQLLGIRKSSLLLRSAFGGAKCVTRIARKSAGKIMTVVGIASAAHSDFVAVIKLRNAAHGQQNPVRQPEFFL